MSKFLSNLVFKFVRTIENAFHYLALWKFSTKYCVNLLLIVKRHLSDTIYTNGINFSKVYLKFIEFPNQV